MRVLARALGVTVAIGTVAVAAVYLRSRHESVMADRAIARLELVRNQIREIEQLREAIPEWASRARREADSGGLASAVTDVLAAAGVPASSLASLSPAADVPMAITGSRVSDGNDLVVRRRRAVVTLAPITLPQLGGLLIAWRVNQPDWMVTTIDLTPEVQGRREPAPGSDLPLRAVIGLETVYVDGSVNARRSGVMR